MDDMKHARHVELHVGHTPRRPRRAAQWRGWRTLVRHSGRIEAVELGAHDARQPGVAEQRGVGLEPAHDEPERAAALVVRAEAPGGTYTVL